MKALVIAGTDVRRLLRWRANIFFIFVLPMLIILLLGAVFGGSQKARLGVLDRDGGALARQFAAILAAQPATQVVRYTGQPALQHAVARGEVDAGVVIPAGYQAQLAAGAQVTVAYLGRPDSSAQQLRSTVQSVGAQQGAAIAAAQALARAQGIPVTAALPKVRAVAAQIPRVTVTLTAPDGGPYTTAAGRFESSASTELVLFIFFTSLTGAAFVIETRRLGIARRVLSTPTSTTTIIGGQLLGRLGVALVQAVIIVVGSTLFFGVSWGDPLGTAAVILALSLVGAGAAMLVASLCATAQQAQAVAFLLGLGMAALGGSMAPLEVFPPAARALAHITPHAWANDAFSHILKHGAGLTAVAPQVGVLLAFAALATVTAIWRTRRALTA